jgi:diaminopimelate decarboxylase
MTPYLVPRTAPRLRSLLDQAELLQQLVAGLGSPLNLVLPEQIAENVAEFRAVYRTHRLAGQIFFAHKANRSSALIRQLAAGGAGIDVASLGELQHALGAGFDAPRIMATGPKDAAFLTLAARAGVLVNTDTLAEVRELASIVAAHRLPPVRVLARLSAFPSPGTVVHARRSRFGTPAAEVPALLDLLEKHAGELDLVGMAYHLDTTGIPEKAAALEGCLRALDDCHLRGMRPRAVDVGGGFGVNYLADGAQWERYTTELTRSVLGHRPPMTWNGHGYGLRNEGGKVRGALTVYPGYRPVAGAAYLDQLLATPSPSLRRPLGTLLLDNMYDLYAEPGRALLDQCGAVLATVLEVREDGGDTLVRLDLNAGDVSLEEHGVLMDPVLVGRPAEAEPTEGGPAGVYLLGNLCLEADLITRRKVFLPARPRPGDLLAFVNTAGYAMDLRAGHALMQPVARTVALHRAGGAWRWCLDERYWPAAPAKETE